MIFFSGILPFTRPTSLCFRFQTLLPHMLRICYNARRKRNVILFLNKWLETARNLILAGYIRTYNKSKEMHCNEDRNSRDICKLYVSLPRIHKQPVHSIENCRSKIRAWVIPAGYTHNIGISVTRNVPSISLLESVFVHIFLFIYRIRTCFPIHSFLYDN